MDAPCEIQRSIHVFRLVNNMCPGKWVHIIFGTYGWSGESTKVLREELTKYGFAVVEPEIKCNWNPDASDLNKAEELVNALLA